MERTCQAQLLAEAAGHAGADPSRRGREDRRADRRATGAGWYQFQPLYDWIVAEEPDLLEE